MSRTQVVGSERRDLDDSGADRDRVRVRIVDADVHPVPYEPAELLPYMPDWLDVPPETLTSEAASFRLWAPTGGSWRKDTEVAGHGPPGASPDLMEQQLLGDADVDYAILIPLIRTFYNVEHESALASATNGWLADTWLTKFNEHGRYWGSINVAAADPHRAVEEIEKWADHPRMIQVRVNTYADGVPLGSPQLHPIYEAANQYDIPVALHIAKGTGSHVLTPVGFPTYFFEQHALYPLIYAPHLISFLTEGVFDRYPSLRVVFVEGGFAWSRPLLWRLDEYWKLLQDSGPSLERKPSEYVKDHIRFTSQPIEEPETMSALQKILDVAEAQELLMFASDYPHFDYDDPNFVIRGLPKKARSKVLGENALEFYGLPPEREVHE